jgi:hypothetical protein
VCVEAHAICYGRIAQLHARRQRLSAKLAAVAATPITTPALAGAAAPTSAASPRTSWQGPPGVGGGSDGDADSDADGDADADDLVSAIEATVAEERQEHTAWSLAMCATVTPRQMARVRRGDSTTGGG